jgi:hypothetical protein
MDDSSSYIVSSFNNVLNSFLNEVSDLFFSALDDAYAGDWNAVLSVVLPPLLSIIALYFTIVSMWRSTMFAFRVGWFIIKWGTLVTLAVGGYSWIQGGGSFDDLARMFRGDEQESEVASGSRYGKPWERFRSTTSPSSSSRARSRSGQGAWWKRDNPTMSDRVIEYAVNNVWDAVEKARAQGDWLKVGAQQFQAWSNSARKERKEKGSTRSR